MTTFTKSDFWELFRGSEEESAAEQIDDWLKTEFLYVRTDAPQPGVWMDLAGIERMALSYGEASVECKGRHPLNDLSAPVLPFPFDMADFMALAESECFKHSSARWPTDADVKTAQSINPRTKTLMMVLQGHMLPPPRADGGAPAAHTPPTAAGAAAVAQVHFHFHAHPADGAESPAARSAGGGVSDASQPPAAAVTDSTAAEAPPTSRPLATPELADAFDGINDTTAERWRRRLGDLKNHAWLTPARATVGVAPRPATWWPLKFAELLLERGATDEQSLNHAFLSAQSLRPWLPGWQEARRERNAFGQ